MPVYEFDVLGRDDKPTRKRLELLLPMADAPSIGSIITRDGVRLRRRLATGLQFDAGEHRTYPYVSTALPRGLSGCRLNKQGKPIITSRRHESEVASRHGLTRD